MNSAKTSQLRGCIKRKARNVQVVDVNRIFRETKVAALAAASRRIMETGESQSRFALTPVSLVP